MRSVSQTCLALTDLLLALLLGLFVWRADEMSVGASLVFFGLLCVVVLDAARPSARAVAAAGVALLFLVFAGVGLHFASTHPLNADASWLGQRLAGAFFEPLPGIGFVASLACGLHLLLRAYTGARPDARPAIECLLLVAIALLAYRELAPWREEALPAASALLGGAGLLFAAALGAGAEAAFRSAGLAAAYAAAFALVAAHGLVLGLGGVEAGGEQLALATALLGPVLVAVLWNARLATAPSRRRLSLALLVAVGIAVVRVWLGAELMPDGDYGFRLGEA